MSGTVGTYSITILGPDGYTIDTFDRTTRTGVPRAGEEIAIDGVLYRVETVRHEEEDDRTRRRYTRVRIIVWPIGPQLVLQ